MACNIAIEDTNVEERRSENETVRNETEEKVKHCFSEPWKDSDVILVVEDEKFHVHRLILSMNSPVFEAMFKSQFKESTANEIPLPEKKAIGVLDFLKIIYGFQYIKERVEITMENVEHLLKLSDEYQIKELIFDPCVKFLEDQPKTQENVMKILTLANLFNLEKVRQGCIDLLKNMKLETLSETVHLQELDKEKTEYYLTQRIERLETFLDEMYPQFMGLVASLMWLMKESKKVTSWCSKHAPKGKLKSYISRLEMSECSGCKQMLSSMVTATTTSNYSFDPTGMCREVREPYHGYKSHFDYKLFSVMADLSKLK
ncbi:kelch-like protein 24 isoform X2 [Oculina patagonica]